MPAIAVGPLMHLCLMYCNRRQASSHIDLVAWGLPRKRRQHLSLFIRRFTHLVGYRLFTAREKAALAWSESVATLPTLKRRG